MEIGLGARPSGKDKDLKVKAMLICIFQNLK